MAKTCYRTWKTSTPSSQGSVERANGDIKEMLVAWIGDNKTDDWSCWYQIYSVSEKF